MPDKSLRSGFIKWPLQSRGSHCFYILRDVHLKYGLNFNNFCCNLQVIAEAHWTSMHAVLLCCITFSWDQCGCIYLNWLHIYSGYWCSCKCLKFRYLCCRGRQRSLNEATGNWKIRHLFSGKLPTCHCVMHQIVKFDCTRKADVKLICKYLRLKAAQSVLDSVCGAVKLCLTIRRCIASSKQ